MNELQLTLILAWYYLDKSNNIDKFTREFNRCFGEDYSAQTMLFMLTKFDNANPANNRLQSNAEEYYGILWRKYITNDRVQELKELYKEFKQGQYFNRGKIVDDCGLDAKPYTDEPIPKNEQNETLNTVYSRSKQVVVNALYDAKYSCELNCTTELFQRKVSRITYTEAHHLIPLCYQDYFDYSLDVEANVVSLCANCHRRLHYGSDVVDLLKTLYEHRKERLEKCGLSISFAQLLMMYR